MEREDWLNSGDPHRAAAAWHAMMDSQTLSEKDRSAFSDWLRKSPTHVEEFMRLAAVREQLRNPSVFEGVSLEELRTRIGLNVESLGAFPTPSLRTSEVDQDVQESEVCESAIEPAADEPRASRRPFAMAASILLLSALGILAWREGLMTRLAPNVYTTAIGEQRSIILPDGSLAEINTRSSLRLHFDHAARKIILTEGEALFRVAKDPRRPFLVYSGEAVVQAIGTEFTVRRDASKTTITVLEGQVSVAKEISVKWDDNAHKVRPGDVPSLSSSRIEVAAGQRLAVSGGNADSRSIQRIDKAAALAWTTRRLVFDDLRLDAVVAEFNRYNTRQIRVEGADLETRSITGVFNANDPASFINFVQNSADVTVGRNDSGDVVIRHRVR